MPGITATPLPAYGWMRLTVDYSDQSWVFAAKVERVDVATGVPTPVRPHTAYTGWYQALGGGGQVVMYDTEAPVDRPFYYQTTAINDDIAFPQVISTGRVLDTFSRTIPPGDWGTSNTGHPWTVNAPAQFSVPSFFGQISIEATGARRLATIGDPMLDGDVVTKLSSPAAAVGGSSQYGIMSRYTGSDDHYWAELLFNPSMVISLRLMKRVAAVNVDLTGTLIQSFTHNTGLWYWLQLRIIGNRIRVRAWPEDQPPPTTWQIDVYDSSLSTAGVMGARTILAGGASVPKIANFDWFSTNSLDAGQQVIHTLDSQGGFWLRSPLRPYKDRRILLRPSRACPPVGGTFFAAMDPRETFSANAGTVSPANRRLAQSVSRPRRGLASTLTVVTKTFADRDELLDTLSDGTALQWVSPPEYGIPPMYMAVGDVDVNRGLSDHRFQARAVGLPFTQVAQPGGPGAGVTGARFKDLCATYATWDAAATAGVSYNGMITVA